MDYQGFFPERRRYRDKRWPPVPRKASEPDLLGNARFRDTATYHAPNVAACHRFVRHRASLTSPRDGAEKGRRVVLSNADG